MVGSIGKMVADSLLMRHCEIKLTTEQICCGLFYQKVIRRWNKDETVDKYVCI